jgi:hypothetical protein
MGPGAQVWTSLPLVLPELGDPRQGYPSTMKLLQYEHFHGRLEANFNGILNWKYKYITKYTTTKKQLCRNNTMQKLFLT